MEITLEEMTIRERLQLMDRIWDSLLSHEDELPSPDWHKEVLDKRRKNLSEGRERRLDWKSAKEDILSRVHED